MSVYRRKSGRYAVLVDLEPSALGGRRRPRRRRNARARRAFHDTQPVRPRYRRSERAHGGRGRYSPRAGDRTARQRMSFSIRQPNGNHALCTVFD
jgi:hypothetical protein